MRSACERTRSALSPQSTHGRAGLSIHGCAIYVQVDPFWIARFGAARRLERFSSKRSPGKPALTRFGPSFTHTFLSKLSRRRLADTGPPLRWLPRARGVKRMSSELCELSAFKPFHIPRCGWRPDVDYAITLDALRVPAGRSRLDHGGAAHEVKCAH